MRRGISFGAFGPSFCLMALAVLIAGCEKETEAVADPPRPIKTFTVSEAAGGMVRRFSGVMEAAETTDLSFPVAGTVQEILVGVGDAVLKDMVLARLDAKPFELDFEAAQAEVEKARADVTAKKGELERSKTLLSKGWVAAAATEQHQAAYDAAVSSLNYARSRQALAERNHNNTTLRAPFAGTIAARPVERYEDVAAGQKILELNSTGALQVSFSVPETSINRISLGQEVDVGFASIEAKAEGRITEIGTVASAGNAYTVKASLLSAPEALKSGMTAQVSITDAADSPDSGYFVPLSAIGPGDGENVGVVFKYDAAAGIVRRTPIKARGVRENLVIVLEGVAPGDVLAAAGVSFLMDGQAVRLLEE
jgi:RND family efflux transporter MFP subunit